MDKVKFSKEWCIKKAVAEDGTDVRAGFLSARPGELLFDGQPCAHPGCLNHITHPCENCGRIGGRNTGQCTNDPDDDCPSVFVDEYGDVPGGTPGGQCRNISCAHWRAIAGY